MITGAPSLAPSHTGPIGSSPYLQSSSSSQNGLRGLPPLDMESPSSGSPSSESSSSESSSSDDKYEVVTIPDEHSRYSNFKYRLWFTWNTYGFTLTSGPPRPSPWFATVWLWEDEDEEYIEEVADVAIYPFREMSKKDWDDACQVLEARQSRTMASPLAHLTPQMRLRFMAWLIVGNGWGHGCSTVKILPKCDCASWRG
jgi:hypothetical protein